MNELMRNEILDQPEAIRQTVPELRRQLPELLPIAAGMERIIFTGSGDSYFAPLALEHAAWRHLGLEVHVLPSQIAARYWPFSARDLLVAVSISGEAGRTVEAAQTARRAKASVLAVTVNEASSLANLSDGTLIIPFRSRSRKTPHTTDYLTTLAAIAVIIEALGNHHFPVLDDLAETVMRSLDTLDPRCNEVAQELKESNHFYFLGTGPNFGTVQYAAAKFWEVGGLRAFPFELEEFAHGPHMLVDAGDPVFIISPDGNSLDRAGLVAEGMEIIGARSFMVTDHPGTFNNIQTLYTPPLPEEWSPFGTSLSMQWLCWAIATVKGYDVLVKDGLNARPELYEQAQRQLVRDTRPA